MYMTMPLRLAAVSAALALGCAEASGGVFEPAWTACDWISVPGAPVFDGKVEDGSRAADGTSWFATCVTNEAEVVSASWRVAGLGVFDVYINGRRVGTDFLKPGFTHAAKTKYSFEYDVTALVKKGRGEVNALAAEVSAGWWRDKILTPKGRRGFLGRKSAFRGVLELTCADGSRKLVPSDVRGWKCGIAGPVKHAAIFDGEEYDARVSYPCFGEGLDELPERNDEFKGEVLPSVGAEVVLRRDLALKPVRAYAWKGVKDASSDAWGKIDNVRNLPLGQPLAVRRGETLVVDFGQNAAAVPEFVFRARRGVTLTAVPSEMLNDRNGERARGNDGPEGSVYCINLRGIWKDGARLAYTFEGTGNETYRPRFTYFGYRYLSLTATDDVTIESVASVPVSSVTEEMEIGKIETGNDDLNRFISNVRWGQLSNYLSVPTDCPQRDERLGWTADTQVFAEAGSFLADTRRFFRKWMRDMRDSVSETGSFPGVAPFAQYGNDMMRIGWADAGVIVPWTVWRQYGETAIIDENWAAMEKFVGHVAETRYRHEAIAAECRDSQWADWLSYEDYETNSGRGFVNNDRPSGKVRPETYDYWDYLGGCYWLYDAQLMREMAMATGRDAERYAKMADEAKTYLKTRFFAADDGLIQQTFRKMQTPAVFALKFGLVEGLAKEKTLAGLVKNIADHGNCLQTGFLGTGFLMDVLVENAAADVAYTLLFQHKNPSWLYSVDQGATTVWERWNSYTIDKGFGPVSMNSFNHYAYGAVLAWMFRNAAGISAAVPGFRRITMKPIPNRRLGFVKAEYKSASGVVKSAWRYDGDKWTWAFSVPEGVVAEVTVPGEKTVREYGPGEHKVVKVGM